MHSLQKDSSKFDLHLIADIFKALGCTSRLEILNFLIANPNSNSMQIVESLPQAQSTISKHLSQLKSVNIVTTSSTPNDVLLYQINKDFITIIQGFLSNVNYKIFQTQNRVETAFNVKINERKKSTHLKKYNYIFKKINQKL